MTDPSICSSAPKRQREVGYAEHILENAAAIFSLVPRGGGMVMDKLRSSTDGAGLQTIVVTIARNLLLANAASAIRLSSAETHGRGIRA